MSLRGELTRAGVSSAWRRIAARRDLRQDDANGLGLLQQRRGDAKVCSEFSKCFRCLAGVDGGRNFTEDGFFITGDVGEQVRLALMMVPLRPTLDELHNGVLCLLLARCVAGGARSHPHHRPQEGHHQTECGASCVFCDGMFDG